MALRASETFIVALKDGKHVFEKNEVVPKDVAKGRESLVFDDTKTAPPAAPHVGRPREAREIPDVEVPANRGRAVEEPPVEEPPVDE